MWMSALALAVVALASTTPVSAHSSHVWTPLQMARADRYDALTREYQIWNRENGLNLGSADEHLFDEDLTQAQRDWLRAFVTRWEAVLTEDEW